MQWGFAETTTEKKWQVKSQESELGMQGLAEADALKFEAVAFFYRNQYICRFQDDHHQWQNCLRRCHFEGYLCSFVW